MRLILTGDIHLGRSSSRIPENIPRESLRAAAAWSRIVDLAIEEGADLVCLSGDIADQTNKFWESIGPLKQGIQKLTSKGIRTVAVAGNHDYDVLPRLADQLPPESFTLLGESGKWERVTIRLESGEALNIDGWSFPSASVTVSPLDTYNLTADPVVPTLGMVHGDLDVASSPYAPLTLTQLHSLGPAGWLLGHIHAPRLIEGPPWVVYPGSPQAFDPGETGTHGPWILEVNNGMIGVPVQVPLSTVCYHNETIDLSDIANADAMQSYILERIQSTGDAIARSAGFFLTHTSLRLKLTGKTPISHLVAKNSELITSDLVLPMTKGSLTVEKVEDQTIPPIDLLQYSKSNSAAGAVAGLLLELEKKHVSEAVEKLILDTVEKLRNMENSGTYGLLKRRETDIELARKYLRASSRALLTELVGQIDG